MSAQPTNPSHNPNLDRSPNPGSSGGSGAAPVAPATVKLSIDGRPVEAAPGTTIFMAAKNAGIDIPHLCYHPALSVAGACRLCLVEVEGARGLITSCAAPVAEGMVVRTTSEKVHWARKAVLEFIVADHPLACLTCEKSGDCQLQSYAYRYGVTGTEWPGQKRQVAPDATNPFFERDLEKCILCGRCIRMCQEVQAVGAIDFAGRGFSAKVTTAYDVPLEESECVFCGNCVGVCPVGALTPKLGLRQGRGAELATVSTTCPYCGVGCQLDLKVKGGRIIRVDGGDGAANHGLLCVKGRFGWDFVHHPDRLTAPLVRNAAGELVPATWAEAMELVASRLKGIVATHGPDAVAGLASAKCTNEENYLVQKIMRAGLGTNNVDHCARLCHASTVTGLAASFGSGAMTNSIDEIAGADLVFVIGSNTTEAHPVIGLKIKEARRRGAKLVVADPRQIELARLADLHLQHLPGSDVALLNGMMNVILAEGLANEAFIAERCENFEAFKAVVDKYRPEVVEAVTGVPAAKLREAAVAYARAARASIIYSMGITQHTTGVDNVQSVANLALLTGNLGRESVGVNPLRGQNNVQGACDMGALPNVFPGYQPVTDPNARDKFEKAWGRQLPALPGLTVTEILGAVAKGQVKGLFVLGENPMLSDPDQHHVEEALRKTEFLVVQDIFLTETAALAHVVLPGVSFAEKEGTFTNTERRVQRVRRAVPPAAGSRPDWVILADLAGRFGLRSDYASPSDIMDEIASLTPSYGGISFRRLDAKPVSATALGAAAGTGSGASSGCTASAASAAGLASAAAGVVPAPGGLQWPCPTADHPGTPFLHKDKFTRGKGLFVAVDYLDPAEMPDDDYPLILTTGRVLYHFHTSSMSRRSAGLACIFPEGYVEVNPTTAAELGVAEGDPVRVVSRRGAITIRAAVTGGITPGVVFIPFHFREAAANVLTNPVVDPKAKIPEFKVCAVRVERVGAKQAAAFAAAGAAVTAGTPGAAVTAGASGANGAAGASGRKGGGAR